MSRRQPIKKKQVKKRERAGEYVGFRSPSALKEKLEAVAAAANRSLSSEAQLRLEKSFDSEGFLNEALALAYGRRVAGLILAMARALYEAGVYAAQGDLDGWVDDPYAYQQAMIAVQRVLALARPEGEPTPPAHHETLRSVDPDLVIKPEGLFIADALAEALAGGEVRPAMKMWAEPLRGMIGDIQLRVRKRTRVIGGENDRPHSPTRET